MVFGGGVDGGGGDCVLLLTHCCTGSTSHVLAVPVSDGGEKSDLACAMK